MSLLQDLLDKSALAVRPAEFLASAPAPLPDGTEFDRVEGMLLGLAVGDSLGVTSEGLRPEDRREPPQASWWVDRFIEVARPLETDTVYRPRGPHDEGFAGTLTQFVEEKVPAAFERGLSVVEACESWYSGAYLLETVPCVLYILMCHGDDAETAIIRAVYDTRDNDTTGAIVGAAVGALHGRQALPDRWIEGHTGRTRGDDEGHIFELIEAARQQWWDITPPVRS